MSIEECSITHLLSMFSQVCRSVPKEGRDELSALNLILQDTATEIIDIASIEHTQGVEQADYNEKAAHYAKRLGQVKAVDRKRNISLIVTFQQVGAQLVARHSNPPPLMVEAPSAAQLERMQSLEPISQVRLVHLFSCQMMLHRLVDSKI